jgi:hypothetical protein
MSPGDLAGAAVAIAGIASLVMKSRQRHREIFPQEDLPIPVPPKGVPGNQGPLEGYEICSSGNRLAV